MIIIGVLVIAVIYLFSKSQQTTPTIVQGAGIQTTAPLPPTTVVQPTPVPTQLYTENAQGNFVPAGVIAPSPPTPVLPHLLPGAALLSDQQIAQQTADKVLHFKNSPSDKARFISEVQTQALVSEIITSAALQSQCGGQFTYQGPNIGITIAKDGTLALSVAGSAGAALGGTFGSAAGFAGTGFAAAGTLAGTAIPIIGAGIGAAIAIYSIITAHHKAAVVREQSLECSLLPPLNKSLQVIEQAVVTGTISVQQGINALNQLITDFTNQATGGPGGLTDTAGTLNAMGWYKYFLVAITIKKSNRYANLTQG